MDILLERIRSLSTSMTPRPTGLTPALKHIQGVRCVAFDFYGTLFISGVGDIGVDEEKRAEGMDWFDAALVDSGFEVHDEAAGKGLHLFERKIRTYIDENRSEEIDYPEPDIVEIWFAVLQDLEQKKYIRGELDHEAAQRFAVEYEFRFNPVWPMPDIRLLLDQLRNRGYLLGIISNSQFYTPLAFEALMNSSLYEAGFDPDLLVWSYKAGVKKPSPHLYRRFMERLERKHHLVPAQVLYLGNDMLKDIKPASEIGMKTALFGGDRRSLKLRRDDPECERVEPDLVISAIHQLAECL